MPPVWLASMSDSCPTRAGCCELPRPADAERCSCTAPFADTHRPRPTLQTAPIGLLFSLGRLITLLGLAETESSLSYCQLPADQPATEARSAKPGTESIWCRPHKTTMPPSCDSAQKRNHRPRRGPASGAL